MNKRVRSRILIKFLNRKMIQTCDLLTCGVLTLTLSTEFDLLLCQPMFEPFQAASTKGDLASTSKATVLVTSKYTQNLYILRE